MPYADPAHCPDCRHGLVGSAQTCPSCGLRLTGPVAIELFRTLLRADDLLARLRASSVPAAVSATGPASATVTDPGTAPRPTSMTEGVTAYPTPQPLAPTRTARRNRGILEAGVPQILLGLGALCLVVGALVFLAIAWVLLGVGGRTVVLATMGAAAAAASYLAARRPLIAATEAFGSVALALVPLVLIGAGAAGWLGEPGPGAVTTWIGAGLVALGIGATVLARSTPARRLLSGEVAAMVGALLVGIGVSITTESVAVGLTLATTLLLAVALLGRGIGHDLLALGAGSVGALTWIGLAIEALARAAADPTFTNLWLEAHGWPFLAAAVLAAVPALLRSLPREVRLIGAAAAGASVLCAGIIPLHGVSMEAGVVGWSLALLALAALAPLVGRDARPALLGPAIAALAVPTVVLLDILQIAVASIASVAPDSPVGIRIDPFAGLLDQPWVALLAALGVAAAVAGGAAQHVPAARGDRGGVLLVALTGVAVTAASGAPLAVVVAQLLLLGVVLVGLAIRHESTELWLVALGVAAVAVLAAHANFVLLTCALGGATIALTLGALAARPEAVRTVSEFLLAPAFAGWWVALGAALDLPDAPVRAVALVAAGVLFAVPGRTRIALGAGISALVLTATVFGGPQIADWLSVHLTLAAVAAGAAALLHQQWHRLGWASGALGVLASWVRLAEAGVSTPEAYTLPAALVLLALGIRVLVRDPRSATGPTLLAGLVLALTPSTLLALSDPATLRGLLVGLAALALVLAGAALHWSAPLIAGAIVGALLLMRALAPYTALVPPYVVILAAGVVLVTVGVTWENRLASLRRSREYVARLR